MTKKSYWIRQLVSAVLAVVFFLAALSFLLPGRALDATPTLKVYAQYWADPDSVQLLGEYSREQLEELSNSDIGYEGYYCNVTRVNTLMRIHARGILLADFLSDTVGVDLNSVRNIDFHTADDDIDVRFLSKGRNELFDRPLYYYPNLVSNSHYDKDLDDFVIDDEVAAMEDAIQVPTIIATVQYSTKNPYDNMSSEMTAEGTLRLCAGQPDLTKKTSNESARWIDAIYVVLIGKPPEEPTEPDEKPIQPDENPSQPEEKPTGSDITPPPETPANNQNQPKKTTGSNIKPAPTTRRYTPATTRRVSQRTVSTTQRYTVTNRTVTMTTRSPYIAQPTTAVNSEQMGQLVVEGYDSMIQWKKESPDGVTALQKPLVKTSGVRNALLLFLASFAAGAYSMYSWFKKER